MNWLDICALEEINALGSRIIAGPKGDIAIFRTSDDEVFALDDRCPHKGGPLSQGLIYGKRVACPLHNWQIDLETGEAQAPDIGCAHHHRGPGRKWPGAAGPAGSKLMNHQITASTCCYCGVGCGVLIEHDGERILGVSGDPAHPANFGKLCSKGSTLHLTGDLAARALYPELRLGKGLARSRTDWDTALDHAASVFAETIAEHGPDSVAFYISGQLLTEDYYAFNKLARALVGTNNIDSNSRLCMSSAVVGYKRSLGADAPPCSYEDLELSDCVMIVGSNMAYAHPVLFRRLEEAKSRRPQMKVIVIDPRRTDTCDLADLHLAILPGTDVALFHGILHLLLWEDWIDRDFIKAHTEGLAELKSLVRDYTPQMVSQLCGISIEQLQQCAEWVGTSPSFLSLWCMGLEPVHRRQREKQRTDQSAPGHRANRPPRRRTFLPDRSAKCHGRTGNRQPVQPAARPSRSRQCRTSCASGGLLGRRATAGKPRAHRHRTVRAGAQRQDQGAVDRLHQPRAIHAGPERRARSLQACPFVVLQEAFRTTETAAFADLLLPAASWGEKEGTVTNSERRISHVRQAIVAPGEARAGLGDHRRFRTTPGKTSASRASQPVCI